MRPNFDSFPPASQTSLQVRGGSTPVRLTSISDVWANGDADVWAGLQGGLGSWSVLHYDGSAWSTMPINLPPQWLSGNGQSDMWAASQEAGFIGHFDGHGWQVMNTGVRRGSYGYAEGSPHLSI